MVAASMVIMLATVVAVVATAVVVVGAVVIVVDAVVVVVAPALIISRCCCELDLKQEAQTYSVMQTGEVITICTFWESRHNRDSFPYQRSSFPSFTYVFF
jgi:hypothetical protein